MVSSKRCRATPKPNMVPHTPIGEKSALRAPATFSNTYGSPASTNRCQPAAVVAASSPPPPVTHAPAPAPAPPAAAICSCPSATTTASPLGQVSWRLFTAAGVKRRRSTRCGQLPQELLGVGRDQLEAYGAVSEPVAAAMAEGACRRFGADLAVATTGIAGPGGGSEDKPVGTVCFALAKRGSSGLIDVKAWTVPIADLGRTFVRDRAVFEVWRSLLQ